MDYKTQEKHFLKPSLPQNRHKTNNTGMPYQLKTNIEAISGYSLDDIKIHYNSSKPASLNAFAYSQGSDIHIAPRQEKYLPHEAWHIIQQKQGRVHPTEKSGGMDINDDPQLEHEADIMGQKAVQMKAAPFSVFQLQTQNVQNSIIQKAKETNVNTKDEIDTNNLPALQESEKPIIIYECMGTAKKTADSIYNQTKLYSGNTFCVFGLNKRDDTLSGEIKKLDDKKEAPHSLINFAFLWKKPKNVKENDQYTLPFIEARKLVMLKAEAVRDAISEKAAASDDLSGKFIYRWIDQDAEDDTSDNINPTFLENFSSDEAPRLATGVYNWRHENAETKDKYKNYHEFIEKINAAEYELREKYFSLVHLCNNKLVLALSKKFKSLEDTAENKELKDQLKAYGLIELCNKLNAAQKAARESLKLTYDSEKYLPGFYLPESTLLMNEAAHKNMIKISVDDDKVSQERESMKFSEKSGVSAKEVHFITDFSVSKPLKHEFAPETETDVSKKSYFFNSKMRALFTESLTKDNLKDALGSLRQSAFDISKWYIKEERTHLLEADFNKFRNEKIDEIETYLKAKTGKDTKFKLICTELNSIFNPPKKQPKKGEK